MVRKAYNRFKCQEMAREFIVSRIIEQQKYFNQK
jgi:hypothetical protein